MSKNNNPVYLKDCALSILATGVRSQGLSDFRDSLATIHPSSIYFHFWVGRLRSEYSEDHYYNDFARWSANQLHDAVLAERLNIVDPTTFKDVESLRARVVDLVEERLEEREFIPYSSRDESFQFIRAILVIFDTKVQIREPQELIQVISKLGDNSLFYHFIDARRRNLQGHDDFSIWLEGFGDYREIIAAFRKINPYFISLHELRHQLVSICESHFSERVRP